MKRLHAHGALPYRSHAFIFIAMTTKCIRYDYPPQAAPNMSLLRAHVSRLVNHHLIYFGLLFRTNVQRPNPKHTRDVRWASKKRHTSLVCFQSDFWCQCVCSVAVIKNKTDCNRSRSLPEEFPFLCSKAKTTNLQIVIFSISVITWSTPTVTCERHLSPSLSNRPHKPCKSRHCVPLCPSTVFFQGTGAPFRIRTICSASQHIHIGQQE